jgi:adenylate kinase
LFVLSQLNTADLVRFCALKPLALMLYGAPGSGKGTLGKMLSRVTAWPHLSTGDLLRKQIAKGTEVGQASQGILHGSFAPDAVVNDLVLERLSHPDCAESVILDGYPRTLTQAQSFLPVLDRMNFEPIVVRLVLDYTEIGKRLRSRRHCPVCGVTFNLLSRPPLIAGRCNECQIELVARPDDSPEFLDRRLADYNSLTAPVESFLRSRHRSWWDLDADKLPEAILNDLLTELKTSSLIAPKSPDQ